MKKWRIHFHGRAVNAIGIFSWHTVSVEAETQEKALIKLYENYEHVSHPTYYEVTK